MPTLVSHIASVSVALICCAAPALGAEERPENPLVCGPLQQALNEKGPDVSSRTLDELLFRVAETECVDLAGRLIAAGASVTARQHAGNTALLIAASSGQEEMIAFLLGKGAEVDRPNIEGSTALILAAVGNDGKAVSTLLRAGARVDPANRQGTTALMAAAFNGNGRVVKMLLSAGADAKAVDRFGKSAIVYAAGHGFADLVKLLLGAGVDVNAVYGNDLTALMWAAGYSNDVPDAEGLQTVKSLITAGAKVDMVDNRGRNALMIAAARGHADVAKYLISVGSDPTRADKTGKTARDLATDDAVRAALVQ